MPSRASASALPKAVAAENRGYNLRNEIEGDFFYEHNGNGWSSGFFRR
jgi:hypothetical protein